MPDGSYKWLGRGWGRSHFNSGLRLPVSGRKVPRVQANEGGRKLAFHR